MELATITMDRNHAREAFLAYRKSVRERHDQEDAEIMRGYRALARGHQLIRLSETLRAGGSELKTFEVHNRWNGRTYRLVCRVPRLAVIRADAKVCFTAGIDDDGGCLLTADRQDRELSPNNRRDRRRIADGTFEGAPQGWNRWQRQMKAIVPNVPPPLRPAHQLAGYQILWEAEWAPDPQPPVDPALLKHIGGDLYAVVAIWDLTPLEQAVLAARADA